MSSKRKILILFLICVLQMSTACEYFAKIWLKCTAKKRESLKMLDGSNSKLLSKSMTQFSGKFLDLSSALKMKATSKQWNNVIIYENVFPDDYEVMVFRKVNTEKILWKTIKFKKFWKSMPQQKELLSHLRRDDVAKWNDVFLWLARNEMNSNKLQNAPFLKKLVVAVAENVSLSINWRNEAWFGYSPLNIAVRFDDAYSILTLIKRGADVYQTDFFGWTPLHVASSLGNINACLALLDSNTNINVATRDGWTPLMRAANKNMFDFLIKKGANENLTTNKGQTAYQLTRFQMR